ncbi:hypothetical protein BO71DRAFT_95646 [Aspergillus ellipticus CBS 707.79]|uniref:Uncharacterized protein n=1 Tax=Aspergillus ellipticus CBS 707.79 TaxID=1448320 RepID=A0A319DUU4_9EURO|nr:hypothetical protein BO71DRAFT_95646 [Aspergillus ellipticus CBS 707.79]
MSYNKPVCPPNISFCLPHQHTTRLTNPSTGPTSSLLPCAHPRRRSLPAGRFARLLQPTGLQPRLPASGLPSPELPELRPSAATRILWLSAASRPAHVLSSSAAATTGILRRARSGRIIGRGNLRGYNGSVGMLLLFGYSVLRTPHTRTHTFVSCFYFLV